MQSFQKRKMQYKIRFKRATMWSLQEIGDGMKEKGRSQMSIWQPVNHVSCQHNAERVSKIHTQSCYDIIITWVLRHEICDAVLQVPSGRENKLCPEMSTDVHSPAAKRLEREDMRVIQTRYITWRSPIWTISVTSKQKGCSRRVRAGFLLR